jgi:hypothetical protein
MYVDGTAGRHKIPQSTDAQAANFVAAKRRGTSYFKGWIDDLLIVKALEFRRDSVGDGERLCGRQGAPSDPERPSPRLERTLVV